MEISPEEEARKILELAQSENNDSFGLENSLFTFDLVSKAYNEEFDNWVMQYGQIKKFIVFNDKNRILIDYEMTHTLGVIEPFEFVYSKLEEPKQIEITIDIANQAKSIKDRIRIPKECVYEYINEDGKSILNFRSKNFCVEYIDGIIVLGKIISLNSGDYGGSIHYSFYGDKWQFHSDRRGTNIRWDFDKVKFDLSKPIKINIKIYRK